MVEVRDLSSNAVAASTFLHHNQYGLFATAAYAEGDVILTESPLAVLSSAVVNHDVLRSQFSPTSAVRAGGVDASERSEGVSVDDGRSSSSILGELLLPPGCVVDARTGSKLRGMLLALASYAAHPPSEEEKSKLIELHHPSLATDDEGNSKESNDAIELAKLAMQCGLQMAAAGSALCSMLQGENAELVMKILLIYTCNAFEGGRIYHRLSRANHSCNPNAVVVEGVGNSSADKNNDVSVLKAACDIAPGDEITISYLGKYLFAGYPIRQRLLRANKHFVCRCARCERSSVDGGDSASRVPCPICHPRAGRYLDDDVMFDDNDDGVNGFEVCYAIPSNGLTAEERSMYCPSCKGTTSVDGGGSMRKKKEGLAIKYMCMAEDKVFDRLNNGCNDCKSDDKASKQVTGDNNTETEQDIDRQFLQMATSVCGSRHWATHFLNLSLIEESLASFHSTLLTMGQDTGNKDAETLEELFVEIAEAADGIERAFNFASSLKLNLDPAHWLFDYTVGLARALVGLGDVKSQKYGSRWIEKVEKYAERFENEGMRKVVIALRDAWKRETINHDETKISSSSKQCEIQDVKEDCKRRKIG